MEVRTARKAVFCPVMATTLDKIVGSFNAASTPPPTSLRHWLCRRNVVSRSDTLRESPCFTGVTPAGSTGAPAATLSGTWASDKEDQRNETLMPESVIHQHCCYQMKTCY